MGIKAYVNALRRLLPRGKFWQNDMETHQTTEITGEMLWAFDKTAQMALRETIPELSDTMLDKWAIAYGINTAGKTKDRIRAAIHDKRTFKGAQAKTFYDRFVKQHEPSAEIEGFLPFTCNRSETGGDDVCGDEDAAFMWFVVANDLSKIPQDILNHRKPAHTLLYFEERP
jgi:uncharacterized protein YmfQ (DUF2313 family)